jgi:methionine-rich copper-binding protein CopC
VTGVPRVALRIGVSAALCAATLVMSPAAGWAADTLVSTVPANGAALATAPDSMRLVFSGVLDLSASHVAAYDDAGTRLNSGALRTVGEHTLVQAVTPARVGTVVAAYHVTFADGGELSGVVRFSVGTGQPPTVVDGGAQRAAVAEAQAAHHGVDALSATLLVADGVVLVGVVLLLLRRRRPPPESLA